MKSRELLNNSEAVKKAFIENGYNLKATANALNTTYGTMTNVGVYLNLKALIPTKKKIKRITHVALITKQELLEAINAFPNSLKDCSEVLGISEASLYNLKKKLGVHHGFKKDPKVSKQDMLDAISVADSLKECTDLLGVSDTQFYKLKKKYGISHSFRESKQEPMTQEPMTQELETQELETQEPMTQEPMTQEPMTQEPIKMWQHLPIYKLFDDLNLFNAIVQNSGVDKRKNYADLLTLQRLLYLSKQQTDLMTQLLEEQKQRARSMVREKLVAELNQITILNGLSESFIDDNLDNLLK